MPIEKTSPVRKSGIPRKSAASASIRPLRWEEHHVKGNGWHGYTATGKHVVYVYQPWDNRIKRGPMPWSVFSYFGTTEHPVRDEKGDERRFKTPKQAKLAAQAYWRREVLGLLGN